MAPELDVIDPKIRFMMDVIVECLICITALNAKSSGDEELGPGEIDQPHTSEDEFSFRIDSTT